MKNLFDFGRAYGFGFESVEDEMEITEVPETEVEEAPEVDDEPAVDTDDMNTQELQEATPQIIDTDDVTNVVDDLGDTFEEGNDERPVGDIDYVPDELQAEIDAIEAQADTHAQVGADMMMPEEPVHEVPGGMDLLADEPVQGMDEVEEYAASVNEINVTGNQGSMDEYMRAEYGEDSFGEDSITDGTNNAETTVSSSDAAPIDSDINGTGNAMDDAQDRGVEEVEVSADDIDGEGTTDEAIGAKDVLGTESEDMDMPEESDEEVEETVEEEPESSESEEIESDEEIDEVSVETTEDGEETCCAEELAIIGELEVELNMDSTILDEEATQEAEQAAAQTELEMTDDALAPVEEAQTINGPDEAEAAPMEDGSNEQENVEIDEDSMMSDVVGEMVAEDSHGDPEAFYEGDIPVNAETSADAQVSEGDASYDEGAGEHVDMDGDVSDDSTDESVEESENVAEEDAIEDSIDGDGEAVDTPEEAESEIEEQTEEASEDASESDSDDVEDIEPEDEE